MISDVCKPFVVYSTKNSNKKSQDIEIKLENSKYLYRARGEYLQPEEKVVPKITAVQ